MPPYRVKDSYGFIVPKCKHCNAEYYFKVEDDGFLKIYSIDINLKRGLQFRVYVAWGDCMVEYSYNVRGENPILTFPLSFGLENPIEKIKQRINKLLIFI
jgi:hypothetical protein